MNPAPPVGPCICEVQNAFHDESQYWIQARTETGLFLTDISGALWNSMGFDKSKMTCRANCPKLSEFLTCITQSYQGINALTSKTGKSYIPDNEPPQVSTKGTKPLYVSADSSVTDGIVGANFDTSNKTSSPFFLIEMNTSLAADEYQTESSIKHNVMSIVSRYYTSSDYLSSFSDASVVYTHKGEPTTLSGIHLRITDSEGNVPALGENNAVFIQVATDGGAK